MTAEDPETSAATETDGADGQTEAAPASAEGDEQDDPNWPPDERQEGIPRRGHCSLYGHLVE